MMKLRTLPVWIAMVALAGCSHTIPETSTKPVAPPQLGKTPPVIQPLSAGQKQAQAPESLLPVTLTADLVICAAVSRARATYCGARILRSSAINVFSVVFEKRRAEPTFSRLT